MSVLRSAALTSLVVFTMSCGRSPPVEWPVREAFDVPPPPGSVSLDVGPGVPFGPLEPGDVVRLAHGKQVATVDVLDVRPDAKTSRVTVTVYAPAAIAEPWVLAERPVTVRLLPAVRRSAE